MFAECYYGGRLGEEATILVEEFSKQGCNIVTRTLEDVMWGAPLKIVNTDIAVGNPEFVRLALKQLGIPIPLPPDYPRCLEPFL